MLNMLPLQIRLKLYRLKYSHTKRQKMQMMSALAVIMAVWLIVCLVNLGVELHRGQTFGVVFSALLTALAMLANWISTRDLLNDWRSV